jgi:hypothetical protein
MGDGSDASSSTGETETGTSTAPSDGSTSGNATSSSTSVDSTTSGDPTASSTTEDPSTSGGPGSSGGIDFCSGPPFFYLGISADEAVLAGGMSEREDEEHGTYVYSEMQDVGIATFTFDAPCNRPYYVWGLVWDDNRDPFDDFGNADTFAVSVDLGAEVTWPYGCQTLYQIDPWAYERVQSANAQDCSGATPQQFPLMPGIHEVTLRNVEAGSAGGGDPGDVAATARLFITDDPDFVPDPDVD